MPLHHDEDFVTPPGTPRGNPMLAPIVAMNSPPRMAWQRGAAMFVDGVLDGIQQVLDGDPDAVWMRFFTSGMQLPFCAAE